MYDKQHKCLGGILPQDRVSKTAWRKISNFPKAEDVVLNSAVRTFKTCFNMKFLL